MGIERESDFLRLAEARRKEIDCHETRMQYYRKIKDTAFIPFPQNAGEEVDDGYGLPF